VLSGRVSRGQAGQPSCVNSHPSELDPHLDAVLGRNGTRKSSGQDGSSKGKYDFLCDQSTNDKPGLSRCKLLECRACELEGIDRVVCGWACGGGERRDDHVKVSCSYQFICTFLISNPIPFEINASDTTALKLQPCFFSVLQLACHHLFVSELFLAPAILLRYFARDACGSCTHLSNWSISFSHGKVRAKWRRHEFTEQEKLQTICSYLLA
jgi:hypothetical protein